MFGDEKRVKQSIPEEEVEFYVEEVKRELRGYWPL
jgi:hypothetical protein